MKQWPGIDLDDLCAGHPNAAAELQKLRRLASERGARLQILRELISPADWQVLIQTWPEADGWFDDDGVPVD